MKNKKITTLLLTLLVSLGIFGKLGIFAPAIAQTTVDINIGDAAAAAAVPGTADYNSGDPQGSFGILISKFLMVAMVIGALMLLLNLLWGGIQWIVSGGDKGKIEKARDKITQSVVGLIVLASTVAIFVMIQNFLGIEVFTFA